jgi:glycogen debranching enzyme
MLDCAHRGLRLRTVAAGLSHPAVRTRTARHESCAAEMATTMTTASPKPSKAGLTSQQHEAVECAFTQSHASRKRVGLEAMVLKRSGTFLVCDRRGDIVPDRDEGLGLFHNDTRFLSQYELTLNGQLPIFLSNEQDVGELIRHDLENDDLPGIDPGSDVPAHTLALSRERRAADGKITDTIRLTNFGMYAVSIRLQLRFAGDFADMLAIRGMAKTTPGRSLEPQLEAGRAVTLRSAGEDGCERFTRLAFSPPPTRIDGVCAQFDLQLDPNQTEVIVVEITPGEDARNLDGATGSTPVQPNDDRNWLEHAAEITGHPVLEKVVRRGLLDLELLRTEHPDGSHYIAGGVPWFVTLFGRDSVWSSIEVCGFQARIAGQTLRLLAKYQATELNAYHCAQPGKILHELRRGQLAHLGRIPQSPVYYGSVDSTPLFLILLSKYVAWTGDLALARELRPNVERALEWVDKYGDSDGDGYLDYGGRYSHGLVNQGWKDSGDAIVNEDGTLAAPPIALAEVQGYLYQAWSTTAQLLDRLGDRTAGIELRQKATALRARFEQDFWSESLGCYVLALQEGRRPAKVVSSNAGQVLWSGLPCADHAARVARCLMAPDMFSGWGVRTLASGELRYNPLSYHLGSVWPHDNAIILRGLRHYGHDREALRIFTGLFAAAQGFRDHRMPELYCGFYRRSDDREPVRYPVACSPQAWAAGALPYALISLLGLQPDALEGCLYVKDPCLPEWLAQVNMRGLRVGQSELDLTFTGDDRAVHLDVKVHRGNVQVRRVFREAPPPNTLAVTSGSSE